MLLLDVLTKLKSCLWNMRLETSQILLYETKQSRFKLLIGVYF